VPIPFARKSRRNVVRQSSDNGAQTRKSTRVKLRPRRDWHRRNYLAEVLIPSLFVKRAGEDAPPEFPPLKPGQIGVTWIGHLDRRTLRKVAADQPIVVPIGVGNLVHDLGFHIVHELDYWQGVKVGPVNVSLTPCYHWGARFLADSHRGFGGFIITAADRTIFHCGDSAFFPGFREIGERHKIDIALLPIGAYDAPTGREVHMNPEEAVRTFIELRAKTLVPMHYGTFRLGYEPMDEPLKRLLKSAADQGVQDKVLVMTEGKPVVL
jgi:L-ascorbate metabolism protein UlaG (beta-lactamase superfamily)